MSNGKTRIIKEELKKNTFSGIRKHRPAEKSSPTPVLMKFDESKMIQDDVNYPEIKASNYLKKGEFPVKPIKNDSFEIKNDSKPGFSLTDYYNLDDPNNPSPLPCETIEKRIADRCNKTDILTNKIMLDIFFLHQNWHIYKRGDGFQEYVKNNLPIGKSYVYDILKGLKLLTDYAENRIKNKKQDNADVLNQDSVQNEMKLLKVMSDPVEILGIAKLRVIAQFPEEVKYKLLESSMKSNISRIKLEEQLKEIQSQNRTVNEKVLKHINEPMDYVDVGVNDIKIGSNGAWIKFNQIPAAFKEQMAVWIKKNINKYISEF